MFSQKDLKQISERGIHIDQLNRQIRYFETGFPYADITMPATPGQGMLLLSEGDERYFQNIYMNNAPDFSVVRFLPASGAASRMFKDLQAAREDMEGMSREQQEEYISKNKKLNSFFKKLKNYAFYEDLKLEDDPEPLQTLDRILSKEGLDYSFQPKALLKFHKYSEEDRRTALEEHLRELVKYCSNRERKAEVHLTISMAHRPYFEAEAARLLPEIESESGISIKLSYSCQLPETDTLAVDPNNEPFRKEDGSLLFRPGGHGALIRNLDAIDADLVFISNIDNVAPDRLKNLRARYKQILGGVLLEVRSKIFYYLQQLSLEEKPARNKLDSIVEYLHDRLGMAIPERLDTWEGPELRRWLIAVMNRPVRVCGMVKNEGEPGGGPYYVRSSSGEVSLQIVEKSQIDLNDPEQTLILSESTHFNPVDLVCSIRDFRGEKFNLSRFVDADTGFISEKTYEGKPLKALELPGLWNGAMAGWLSLFVEVPLETFSPVKEVDDLVRRQHRA